MFTLGALLYTDIAEVISCYDAVTIATGKYYRSYIMVNVMV